MIRHLPNLITCLNLITGSIGVYFIFMKEAPEAIYFVLIGAFFDLLDGFVARFLKVSSELGKQLDSLADLISFGILPAFYMLTLLESKTDFFWIALLIVVFSALRLAMFNIDDSQSNSFKGLPTPANAIMLTSLAFLPFDINVITLVSIIIISSILLVANLRLIALKFNSYGWAGNEPRWILILGIFIFLIVFQWTFLPFIVPFYIGVSLLTNVKN